MKHRLTALMLAIIMILQFFSISGFAEPSEEGLDNALTAYEVKNSDNSISNSDELEIVISNINEGISDGADRY